MEQNIAIEPARESDSDWCATLMSSTEPWITLRRGGDAARQIMQRPGWELFIARQGEVHVGFILLSPYGLAGSPYIVSVVVEESARGRGIGSQLLAFAEKHYAGRRHLFLCVSSFNHRAQQLYQKLGYERVGEFKDYVIEGYSELLMYKRLP